MKKPRPDLEGIDFASIVRRGAADMLNQGEVSAQKRERKEAEYTYTDAPELDVMVFEMRVNPPMWRMETLKEGPNGMGIVRVHDSDPRMLEAEMRAVLVGKLDVYDVCKRRADARWSAATIKIRNVGTVRLRDSERFEGERS